MPGHVAAPGLGGGSSSGCPMQSKSEGRGVNFFVVIMLVFLDIPEKEEKELLSDCCLL